MPYWHEESIYNGPIGRGFTINRTHNVDGEYLAVGETEDNIVTTLLQQIHNNAVS